MANKLTDLSTSYDNPYALPTKSSLPWDDPVVQAKQAAERKKEEAAKQAEFEQQNYGVLAHPENVANAYKANNIKLESSRDTTPYTGSSLASSGQASGKIPSGSLSTEQIEELEAYYNDKPSALKNIAKRFAGGAIEGVDSLLHPLDTIEQAFDRYKYAMYDSSSKIRDTSLASKVDEMRKTESPMYEGLTLDQWQNRLQSEKTRNDKLADKWYKEGAKDTAENATHTVIPEKTQEWIDKSREESEKLGKTGQFFAGLAESGGRMVPSIVAGKIVGGLIGGSESALAAGEAASASALAAGKTAEEAAKASLDAVIKMASAGGTAAGLTVMWGEVYNSEVKALEKQGYDWTKASDKAFMDACVEVATEAFVGGTPGMRAGLFDNVVNPIIEKAVNGMTAKFGERLISAAGKEGAGAVISTVGAAIGNVLTNGTFGSFIADSIGEGAEEAASALLGPIVDRMTIEPNAPDATVEDVLEQAAGGMVMGAFFNMATLSFKNVQKNGQAIVPDGNGGYKALPAPELTQEDLKLPPSDIQYLTGDVRYLTEPVPFGPNGEVYAEGRGFGEQGQLAPPNWLNEPGTPISAISHTDRAQITGPTEFGPNGEIYLSGPMPAQPNVAVNGVETNTNTDTNTDNNGKSDSNVGTETDSTNTIEIKPENIVPAEYEISVNDPAAAYKVSVRSAVAIINKALFYGKGLNTSDIEALGLKDNADAVNALLDVSLYHGFVPDKILKYTPDLTFDDVTNYINDVLLPQFEAYEEARQYRYLYYANKNINTASRNLYKSFRRTPSVRATDSKGRSVSLVEWEYVNDYLRRNASEHTEAEKRRLTRQAKAEFKEQLAKQSEETTNFVENEVRPELEKLGLVIELDYNNEIGNNLGELKGNRILINPYITTKQVMSRIIAHEFVHALDFYSFNSGRSYTDVVPDMVNNYTAPTIDTNTGKYVGGSTYNTGQFTNILNSVLNSWGIDAEAWREQTRNWYKNVLKSNARVTNRYSTNSQMRSEFTHFNRLTEENAFIVEAIIDDPLALIKLAKTAPEMFDAIKGFVSGMKANTDNTAVKQELNSISSDIIKAEHKVANSTPIAQVFSANGTVVEPSAKASLYKKAPREALNNANVVGELKAWQANVKSDLDTLIKYPQLQSDNIDLNELYNIYKAVNDMAPEEFLAMQNDARITSLNAEPEVSQEELNRQWEEDGRKYGTYSRSDTPTQVREGEKVSEFADNVMSQNIGQKLTDASRQHILNAGMNYVPRNNTEIEKQGRAHWDNPKYWTDGKFEFRKALNEWSNAAENGMIGTPEALAQGAALWAILKNQVMTDEANGTNSLPDDVLVQWDHLMTDLSIVSNNIATSLQFFRHFKDMTGSGRQYYMQRMVEELKNDFHKMGGSFTKKIRNVLDDYSLDEGLAKALMTILNDPSDATINSVDISEELRRLLLDTKNDSARIDIITDALKDDIALRIPPTAASRIRAWRMLSMLGNVRTHLRNIISNGAMYIARNLRDVQEGAIEDYFLKDGKYTRNISASAKTNEALKALAEAQYELHKDTIQSGGKVGFKTDILMRTRSFGDNTIGNAMENLSKWNSDLLEREDAAWLKRNFIQTFQSYVAANAKSWTDGDIIAYLNSSMQSARAADHLSQAVNKATLEAQRATYREASDLASWLNAMEKKSDVSRILIEGIVPFKRTPINILKQGVRYSPIGIVNAVKELTLDVKNGKITADGIGGTRTVADAIQDMCAGMTGTMIMALGLFLGGTGAMKAGGSDNDKEEYYDQMLGNQKFSLTIGDTNLTLDWLTPVSMPLFAGVTLANALDGTEGIGLNDMLNAIQSMADPFTELSLLQGVNDAINSYDDNKLLTVATSGAANYASQFIPTMAGQMARTIDQTRRTTYAPSDSKFVGGSAGERFFNKLKNKIPFLSTTNAEYVDMWGRTEQQSGELPIVGDMGTLGVAINQFVSPWYAKKANVTEVDDKLSKLYEQTKDNSVIPTAPQNYFTSAGEKYVLNANEQSSTRKTVGQLSYSGVESAFASPIFATIDADGQAKVISDIYDYARAVAKDNYFIEKGVAYEPESIVLKVQNAESAGLTIGDFFAIKQSVSAYTKDDEKAAIYVGLGLTGEQADALGLGKNALRKYFGYVK